MGKSQGLRKDGLLARIAQQQERRPSPHVPEWIRRMNEGKVQKDFTGHTGLVL